MSYFSRQHVSPESIPLAVREKWTSALLDEGFVPFPKKFVRTLHQIFPSVPTIEELSTVLAIVDYNRPNLKVSPSRQFLAFLAGLEQDRFDDALQRLVDKGYANVEKELDDSISIKLSGLFESIKKFSAQGVC